MKKDIFIVKNSSTNTIELSELGIILPPDGSIDLMNSNVELYSDIYDYLKKGDLKRIIDSSLYNWPSCMSDNGVYSFYSLKSNFYSDSTSYVDVLTLPINNIRPGKYRFATHFGWSHDKRNSNLLVKFLSDSSALCSTVNLLPADTSIISRTSLVAYKDLDISTYIQLQISNDSGSSSNLYDIIIETWKV